MDPNSKHEKILRLLRPEALEAFEKSGFSGRLVVSWKNGEITRFNMKAEIGFGVSVLDENDFIE